MNKLIDKELEIKRLARLFAERQNIKIEVFFDRPPGEKFSQEWLMTNGFHKGVAGGLHKIYINLDRDHRSLVFRTLAHELAHAWQQEVEREKYSRKHDTSFWRTLDDYTLPFVIENLAKEDREELTNLLNPTTNQDETTDWVRFETEEGIISIPVEPENIDEKWKLIRQETIKGNLGFKTHVSTKRTSQDKYRVSVYIHDKQNRREIARVVEKLGELGINESDIKVK